MKEHDEEWKNLCEQAAVEKDPQKLLALAKKINDLLLGKQHRLRSPLCARVSTASSWILARGRGG
jgi:hypothetical protein